MPQTEIRIFRDAEGQAPFLDWLAELKQRDPVAYAKCLQRIGLLAQLGSELRRPIADMLRDGIHELRAKRGHVNYRILYFFHGRNAVVVSHGITKKKEVPESEIDTAVERQNLVRLDASKYTVEWEE